jgi:hypothetical protein
MALAKCDCKNAYQDAHYGQNIRVHNLMGKGNKDSAAKMGRCTVCSKERAI